MRRVFLVGTQGVSPGVIPEAYYNIVRGRVEPSDARVTGPVERVYIVATSHERVGLAAKTALAILHCCLNLGLDRVHVVFSSCEDVVDPATYADYYERVRSVLEGLAGERDALVVLDVTGGRVGMALAAFEAAYQLVRGRLVVTTTQLPEDRYRVMQRRFDELLARLQDVISGVPKSLDERTCVRLREAGLCDLYTGEARTAVLWPPR